MCKGFGVWLRPLAGPHDRAARDALRATRYALLGWKRGLDSHYRMKKMVLRVGTKLQPSEKGVRQPLPLKTQREPRGVHGVGASTVQHASPREQAQLNPRDQLPRSHVHALRTVEGTEKGRRASLRVTPRAWAWRGTVRRRRRCCASASRAEACNMYASTS